MEDQDFAYQSEPEVTESTEPIESAPVEEAPPQAEPKMEYDEIKYNKEAVKIPASERQKYLQMGYHFENKVSKELEQTKQQAAYLDKLAHMSGYTNTQEFLQAVEAAEQQRQMEQEAQRMGIDEETYQQYFAPVNQRLQSYEQELNQLRHERMMRQIESEVQALSQRYPDFQKYEQEVFNMATQKGYSLEDAYRLASYEDRMNNLSRQTEQEVLARITGRDERQVLGSNDKPTNTKLDVASMSFDDIEALSQRVRRGERITL